MEPHKPLCQLLQDAPANLVGSESAMGLAIMSRLVAVLSVEAVVSEEASKLKTMATSTCRYLAVSLLAQAMKSRARLKLSEQLTCPG